MFKKLLALAGCLCLVLASTSLPGQPQASQQASTGVSLGEAWAYSSPTSSPTVNIYGLAFTASYYECAEQYHKTHSEPASFKDVLLSPVVQEECGNG